MSSRSYHHLFKILLVGDAGVGKCDLLAKFEEDKRQEEPFVSTIGIPFRVRDVRVGGKTVRLQLWNAVWDDLTTFTSSNTSSATTTDATRTAKGVLLVYDVTHETSFENTRRLRKVRDEGGLGEVVIMLLGTNAHYRGDDRQVTWQRGKELGDEAGVKFLEVSAVTGTNMEQALLTITKAILAKVGHINE
ncbi:Ras-related protein Rab-8B-like, partial [Homarus americanus]